MAEPSHIGALETAVLATFLERLLPGDDLGSGAAELGVFDYALGAIVGHHAAIAPWIAGSLRGLSAAAERLHGRPFAELAATDQDGLLGALERSEVDEVPDGGGFFNLVHHLMLEGAFGDPRHGGNRGTAGWELIGFPGLRLVVSAEEQELDRPATGPRRSIADYPELPHG